MSAIANVSCPHCNGQIAADPQLSGREVGCPHCNGRVIMPGVARSSANGGRTGISTES